MSLEAKIEDLTAAIHALVAAMGARPVAAPAAPPAVVHLAPASLVPAPAPAATLPKAPFTDQKSLIDYVMSSYKTLGVAKGAQIQQVLVSLGHQNINDVKPENYDALFAGVEALKA